MFASKETREARELWAEKQRAAAKRVWSRVGAVMLLALILFACFVFYLLGELNGRLAAPPCQCRPEQKTPL